MKYSGSFPAVLLTACLLLSACTSLAPAVPSSTVAPLAPIDSDTPRPSSTPLPSSTPQPSATWTLTAAPSATPTLTGTATPTSIFIGFLVQASEYKYDGLSFYFIIPGISAGYRLEVDGKPYTCQVLASQPDHMYCNGPYYPAGQSVTLDFYTQDGTTPVFETAYVVDPSMTATTDPSTWTLLNCPVRGINASCETENRVADNGNCTVSTCVDQCGYWYSVDTCIYKTPFLSPKSTASIARQQTVFASRTQTRAAKP